MAEEKNIARVKGACQGRLDHQTGSNQIWKHPLISGISVNLAGKDSADAKPYQERELREAMRKLQEVQEQQGRHKP